MGIRIPGRYCGHVRRAQKIRQPFKPKYKELIGTAKIVHCAAITTAIARTARNTDDAEKDNSLTMVAILAIETVKKSV